MKNKEVQHGECIDNDFIHVQEVKTSKPEYIHYYSIKDAGRGTSDEVYTDSLFLSRGTSDLVS